MASDLADFGSDLALRDQETFAKFEVEDEIENSFPEHMTQK